MKKIITCLCLLAISCSIFAQNKAKEMGIEVDQLRKLQIAHLAITSLYVDSVDQKKLVENAINGILEKLDPHSSYSNPEDTKKMNEPLEGNFEGIGVQFNILQDTLVVIQPTAKGPSEKAGIIAGDRIIKVDDQPIAGVKMSRDSIMKKLRGPKNSKVKLSIVRRGAKDELVFNITRDKIPVNTIDATYMIAPKVGYIHLDRFGATSGKEMHEAINRLKKEGMQSLIFDLQMNGGGYLGAANEVASEFLNAGDLVVYTEGRAAPKQTLKANGGGLFQNGKLIILVDEYTASAAEIVSGAVQDHDRGTIIGRRTFGKGLVQRPIELPDGSMIRLTVSHYYTPSGRCIQKPYEKGKIKEYQKDVLNRLNHGELTSVDSIHLDSTKVYKTLVKSRNVYGGGGIMPDIFVPLDTTQYTPYYRAISRNNLINEAVLKFVDQHRKSLQKQYKDFTNYIKDYEVPQPFIDEIIEQAKAKKITPKDDKEKAETIADLQFMLKALIAYNIWDRSEYFQLINLRNETVLRALQELQVDVTKL
ncbi:carboxyl-terminal protease [gut metagenome]|uniref:Carboxyl-terminal protease n=1 Tax=gut metagenome TaxID=749906 RepID=J9FLD4_9ZZZZ